jgi:hypothetical protein
MVAHGLKIKIYIDDVIGVIAIKFHSLVLANGSASVPKDSPSIAPWIVDVKL